MFCFSVSWCVLTFSWLPSKVAIRPELESCSIILKSHGQGQLVKENAVHAHFANYTRGEDSLGAQNMKPSTPSTSKAASKRIKAHSHIHSPKVAQNLGIVYSLAALHLAAVAALLVWYRNGGSRLRCMQLRTCFRHVLDMAASTYVLPISWTLVKRWGFGVVASGFLVIVRSVQGISGISDSTTMTLVTILAAFATLAFIPGMGHLIPSSMHGLRREEILVLSGDSVMFLPFIANGFMDGLALRSCIEGTWYTVENYMLIDLVVQNGMSRLFSPPLVRFLLDSSGRRSYAFIKGALALSGCVACVAVAKITSASHGSTCAAQKELADAHDEVAEPEQEPDHDFD